MHVITVLREYLNMTQQELAKRANITSCDLSEIENMEPFGHIMKYERLSKALGVDVDLLVRDIPAAVPASFFEQYSPVLYQKDNGSMGRAGEEEVLRLEKERLDSRFETLSKLVVLQFKMPNSGKGYDILSFDDNGRPIFIEVKTTANGAEQDFRLTAKEFDVAQKLTKKGEQYFIYRWTGWGTTEQTLHKISFQEMVDGARMAPIGYSCSMKDRITEICGVAYYRRLKGMTLEEMSQLLGIGQPHLSRYERGGRRIPVKMYLQMSDLLEVPIDNLLKTYHVSELENA